MFANPYNACTTCGRRVTDFVDNANVPCGHRGNGDEAWKSVCPSWGPVDGCRCDPPCQLPPEATDG